MMKTVTVTKKQHETLLRVRDRARQANDLGQKATLTEAEYQLAKRKFLELQAAGAVIPERVMEAAKRMGFL